MAAVIFVNRYGYPDTSATSQLLSDLAFHLSASGHEVTILCSRLRYEGTARRFFGGETVKGVRVVRLWSTSYGRISMLGRLADYFTFYISAWIGTFKIARRGDCIFVMTDPPLLSIALLSAAALRSAILVNWIQDLFPEVAKAAGVGFMDGIFGRMLQYMRNRSLKAAALNVVIGHGMRDVLCSQGISEAQIEEIPNWPIHSPVHLWPEHVGNLREAWGLTDKFVIGYFGNLGRAHDYSTIVHAADELKKESDVKFLFVGGGYQYDGLREAISRHALEKSFAFLPYQDRDELSVSLAVPDVHWLSLKEEFEGLVVPSKFYGILAAGRPVIAIGDPNGEIGQLVRESGCGITVATGDFSALAMAIRELRGSVALRKEMGNKAINLLERRFSAAKAYIRWEQALSKVVPSNSSVPDSAK